MLNLGLTIEVTIFFFSILFVALTYTQLICHLKHITQVTIITYNYHYQLTKLIVLTEKKRHADRLLMKNVNLCLTI